MWDTFSDLAALAYNDVICEPIVCEGNDTTPALIGDLGVCVVWIPQLLCLVTDTNALSCISCFVADVPATTEEVKKQKYMAAAEACHASFSHYCGWCMLCCSCIVLLIDFQQDRRIAIVYLASIKLMLDY